MLFDNAMVEIACPRCGYVQDVQLLDARLERRIFCPACKWAIQIVDDSASLHTSLERADQALKDLQKKLGG
jgi:phage FluMu protein Com